MSKQPHKQRNRTERAPLHRRGKQLHATLSTDLREEYGTRRTRVNAGDTVEVMRGDHAGSEGEVLRAIVDDGVIHVEDVTVETADGEEVPRPVQPSNVRITDLDLSDDVRSDRLETIGSSDAGDSGTSAAGDSDDSSTSTTTGDGSGNGSGESENGGASA